MRDSLDGRDRQPHCLRGPAVPGRRVRPTWGRHNGVPVMPAALEVRTARPDEFAAIADLTERVYVDGGHADQSYVPTLRDVAGRAASTTVLVALLDGAAVGAVAIATRGGD